MIAIGMGLAFVAYTGGLWGYCLIRGYNITLADMFRTAWPGAAAGTAAGKPAASGGTAGGGHALTNR